ncbi:MAG: hypothetical protein FJW30_07095 [Acidobacteria bacterium]|nr:hypothetical protein [Acidobacteriota bacterium]
MNEWIRAEVSAESMNRVRAGVTRRIRRRRWAQRAALLAPLLAWLAWPSAPELETLSLSMPLPPAAPVVRLAPPVRPFIPAKTSLAEKIILYTNDPDVVIVLVGEGGGE